MSNIEFAGLALNLFGESGAMIPALAIFLAGLFVGLGLLLGNAIK